MLNPVSHLPFKRGISMLYLFYCILVNSIPSTHGKVFVHHLDGSSSMMRAWDHHFLQLFDYKITFVVPQHV